ncbi:MAG: hypothetical protein KME30_08170 [Iphinoe sp. HA4291-MV1]|nr:hypothetical protein [Iphinoe sp. HA4291-MV1]
MYSETGFLREIRFHLCSVEGDYPLATSPVNFLRMSNVFYSDKSDRTLGY